ncbi:MAG: hypothetical protein A3G34_02565 [Candidatus Lindowbacteria bacterium RIFCSPLOWO2_12_FULL_62_27]|nr:MAG: hypothetical protein A3G34_02565 [Candidatus Lindowbacteria bacterium RIFCSPLOWO2_12_FULL_62_27]OGH62831.1 MAG: hypothetical protein A3I06_11180 [Candidatus Lindowbacteria bacterium RIFCSPLOWO2_02_FULL_62_12]
MTFFLARRFLFSRHRSGFVRLLTYLSIGSVGLTLGAFVIVMAVMNGFDRDLQARIISGTGAVRGFPLSGWLNYTEDIQRAVLETPGVTSASAELQVSGLMRPIPGRPGLSGLSEAAVTGVDVSQKALTGTLRRQLQAQSVFPADEEILLGSALADKLGVDRGDSVEAILAIPALTSSAHGGPGPIVTTWRVSGTYRTGYYEFDASGAIVPIGTLRRHLGLSDDLVHSVEIGVSDPGAADAVSARLQARLGAEGLYFRSWREMREPLFRAVRLEKRVMAIILFLFGLVSVFSVLSALTATAVEKRRELAALRAMGLPRRRVAGLFLTAGGICGGLGLLLGSAVAAGGHLLITKSDLFRLPSEVYDLDRLPSEWSTPLYVCSAAILFVLSLAAATFPAHVQSRKPPSEALREE